MPDAGSLMEYMDAHTSEIAGDRYTGLSSNSMAVTNSKNNILYHLAFASKHPLPDKLWQSVTQIDAKGQRRLLGI